jgi:16S rRNA (uracil1498-N3)-methyltransferase
VRKTERLNKIALAAAQQSRQPRPTLVAIHATLQDALVNIPAIQKGCALVCSLRPEAAPIANRLSAEANRPVVIAIGPEGDFAPEEYDTLCIEHNFIPITLGPSILRSELAVVAALSAIRMIELR